MDSFITLIIVYLVIYTGNCIAILSLCLKTIGDYFALIEVNLISVCRLTLGTPFAGRWTKFEVVYGPVSILPDSNSLKSSSSSADDEEGVSGVISITSIAIVSWCLSFGITRFLLTIGR